MAKAENLTIAYEIEPICKVYCYNEECGHFLVIPGKEYGFCNLKRIVVSYDNTCANFRELE